MNQFKSKLLAAGVRNLKRFGYPGVNEQNILTDELYAAFFRRMLQDAQELQPLNEAYQQAILELLTAINDEATASK